MKTSAPATKATKQSLAVKTATLPDTPVSYTDLSGNKVELSKAMIKQYICPDADVTDEECYAFLSLCKFNGYNPFLHDAFCIKYQGSPATMVVSKSAILKRAQKNPNFKGMKSGIVVLNLNSEIEYRKGELYLNGEEILGAWADVYVDGYVEPVSAVVNFNEYVQTKKDKDGNKVPTAMWLNKPATMINKVAQAHALREAFPQDLSDSYVAEEMGYDAVDTATRPPIVVDSRKSAATVYDVDEETGEVISGEPTEEEVQNSFFGEE